MTEDLKSEIKDLREETEKLGEQVRLIEKENNRLNNLLDERELLLPEQVHEALRRTMMYEGEPWELAPTEWRRALTEALDFEVTR